jgi:hypothetical protein
MKTRISGKEAARVAEDMAKPGPIRGGRGTRHSRAIAWVRAGPKGASACPKALPRLVDSHQVVPGFQLTGVAEHRKGVWCPGGTR